MFFLLVLVIIILMVITIRIKIKFKDFEFSSQNKEHLNKNYKVEVTIYTFNFIPILKLRITNKKINKALSNEKIKKAINEQKIKIIENRNDIDIETIKELKNIKIGINEINLNILLGTEDAAITAFIIPIISTFIAIFLGKKVSKCNDKQIFSIRPVYLSQNLINIKFSGIFQIKMMHIINTICTVNKKRKGDKNERTSNRKPYDYSYE